jgi:shikimate kinase
MKISLSLIGMPGVGKSTVGVLLAKQLGMAFVDTDLLIQTRQGKRLAQIIEEDGSDGFCRIEEQVVLTLERDFQVIATGGSVVYSAEAMRHLHAMVWVVFLDIELDSLKKRLKDLDRRGVIRAPGQSIDKLYAERLPLYQRQADLRVDCTALWPDQAVRAVLVQLQGQAGFSSVHP